MSSSPFSIKKMFDFSTPGKKKANVNSGSVEQTGFKSLTIPVSPNPHSQQAGPYSDHSAAAQRNREIVAQYDANRTLSPLPAVKHQNSAAPSGTFSDMVSEPGPVCKKPNISNFEFPIAPSQSGSASIGSMDVDEDGSVAFRVDLIVFLSYKSPMERDSQLAVVFNVWKLNFDSPQSMMYSERYELLCETRIRDAEGIRTDKMAMRIFGSCPSTVNVHDYAAKLYGKLDEAKVPGVQTIFSFGVVPSSDGLECVKRRLDQLESDMRELMEHMNDQVETNGDLGSGLSKLEDQVNVLENSCTSTANGSSTIASSAGDLGGSGTGDLAATTSAKIKFTLEQQMIWSNLKKPDLIFFTVLGKIMGMLKHYTGRKEFGFAEVRLACGEQWSTLPQKLRKRIRDELALSRNPPDGYELGVWAYAGLLRSFVIQNHKALQQRHELTVAPALWTDIVAEERKPGGYPWIVKTGDILRDDKKQKRPFGWATQLIMLAKIVQSAKEQFPMLVDA